MKLTADEAYEKFADRVFAAAFSICQNRADADDVVQETFIKYLSAAGSTVPDFTDTEHVKAWLLRVAINRAKDIRASFWRRHRVSCEEYMEELPFEEPGDGRLFEAVMSLPARYRMVIHLYYYEGYTSVEIARILKKPQSTVRNYLHEARAILRERLGDDFNEER